MDNSTEQPGQEPPLSTDRRTYSGPSDYATARRQAELRERLRLHAQNQAEARHHMLYGGLWCLGGLLVTGATYAFASSGGSFFLAWGPVVFGGVRFFKGLLQTTKSV